jgi:hypothetical protein
MGGEKFQTAHKQWMFAREFRFAAAAKQRIA